MISSAISSSRSRRWKILVTTRRGVKNPYQTAAFKKLVQTILEQPPFGALPDPFSEVSILFCGDEEIHRLNREYRKKDKPTDVLSFPQEEQWAKGFSSPSLGDLVISVDTAKRQARRFGLTLKREIQRLTTHGLLHLAGYDHEKVSPQKAQQMRRAERGIIRKLASSI
jgi:probable rRNA maturation factor